MDLHWLLKKSKFCVDFKKIVDQNLIILFWCDGKNFDLPFLKNLPKKKLLNSFLILSNEKNKI